MALPWKVGVPEWRQPLEIAGYVELGIIRVFPGRLHPTLGPPFLGSSLFILPAANDKLAESNILEGGLSGPNRHSKDFTTR